MKDQYYKRTFEGHLKDFLEKAYMRGDLDSLEASTILLKYAVLSCKNIYHQKDEITWEKWINIMLEGIIEETNSPEVLE